MEAGDSLINASCFKELLSVRRSLKTILLYWHAHCTTITPQLILLVGNYMNGTGIKGGAFGFRVSSINKVWSFF